MDFLKFSYQKHAEHFASDSIEQERIRIAEPWFDESTADYWRHARGYEYADLLLPEEASASWLTVGDGRWGLDVMRIKKKGYTHHLHSLVEEGLIDFQIGLDGYCSSNWLSSIVLSCLHVEDAVAREQRETIMRHLAEKNAVETRPFFYCCHSLPMYSANAPRLPISEYLSARGMNLPSYSGLPEEGIREISSALVSYLKDSTRHA